MTRHTLTTWLTAAIGAFMLAALPVWMDQPTPSYASHGFTVTVLDDGQAELLDAQARAICTATHGTEGGTVRLADGSVRCTNKHGRNAITVLSHQEHTQHPTGGIRP